MPRMGDLCPDCGGKWIVLVAKFDHRVSCPQYSNRFDYLPPVRQVVTEQVTMPKPPPPTGHPPDHDCDGCEDARRRVLVRAFPTLSKVGLSPKGERDGI